MADNKKEKVFAAVLDLFKEGKSVKGIKVSEIAERAGIGKGSIYLYFASKNDVIVEAAKYFFDTWLRPFEEYAVDTSKSFKEIIMGFIDLHIKLIDEYAKFFNPEKKLDYISVFNSSTLPGTIEVAKESRQKYINIIEELLKIGRQQNQISYINKYSVNVVAEAILLIIKYLNISDMLEEENFSVDECKELAYDMILRVCK